MSTKTDEPLTGASPNTEQNEARRSEVLARVASTRPTDLRIIAAAVRAAELFRGDATAEEALLWSLLGCYERDGGLDPEDVRAKVEEFEENFRDEEEATIRFIERHPDRLPKAMRPVGSDSTDAAGMFERGRKLIEEANAPELPARFTQEMRAHLIEDVEGNLETITELCNTEDLFALRELLWGISNVTGRKPQEGAVLNGISWMLGRQETFVTVPTNLREQVRQYVESLTSKEAGEAAA